jgi:two-component system sensor histidine kinase VanS
MKIQRFGIFGKVFLYTLIFLLLAISVTAAVFARQFKDFYDYLQLRQYTAAFEPLKMKMIDNGGNLKEIIQTASEFHSKNQSFAFNIETTDGTVVYRTFKGISSAPDKSMTISSAVITGSAITGSSVDIVALRGGAADFAKSDSGPGSTKKGIVIALNNDLIVRTLTESDRANLYKEFSEKVLMIAFFLLCSSVLGALLFARGITNPIKKLTEDTRKMACLEPVPAPASRRDEVGQLAGDVHNMYEKMKQTISNLETEILREKEMEENQRYFFSAASHELKTPIAAASALLEGMLANIGDYKNHPKYLRECLNMMNAQSRTISEILKIVSLSDKRVTPQRETVNLSGVINGLLEEYHTLAEKKGQNIAVNVPETVYCHTDKKMLGTVLSNVIMNAIKNSPSGEEIRIWSERGGAGPVRLCVLNTNASIDDEMKVKLFEPFYRVDAARSRKDGRSGLGLTIVKKILDSLDVPFDLEMVDSDVVFWLEMPGSQLLQ